MTSNGVEQGYIDFAASHEKIYDTDISYTVEYDEQTWVEGERARRLPRLDHDLQTRREADPHRGHPARGVPRRKDHPDLGTTWPNWSDLDAFATYE
jgi:hypothetical protein